MTYLVQSFAVLLCLTQVEGTVVMEKVDQSLAELVAQAQTPDQLFPVLIMCNERCDPVIDMLRRQGIDKFNLVEELNIISTSVNIETLAKADAMEVVAKIEMDAETGIY